MIVGGVDLLVAVVGEERAARDVHAICGNGVIFSSILTLVSSMIHV